MYELIVMLLQQLRQVNVRWICGVIIGFLDLKIIVYFLFRNPVIGAIQYQDFDTLD